MDFNRFTGAGYDILNCFEEVGFVLAVPYKVNTCGYTGYLGTADASDPTLWTGSPALFSTFGPAGDVLVYRPDFVGHFSMQSADFAPFRNYATPTSVLVTGYTAGGAEVTQLCTVPVSVTTPGMLQPLQTCALGPMFTDLTYVRIRASAYSVQFDNLVFTPSATTVPEPGTAALAAGGLLALGAAVRRRARA